MIYVNISPENTQKISILLEKSYYALSSLKLGIDQILFSKVFWWPFLVISFGYNQHILSFLLFGCWVNFIFPAKSVDLLESSTQILHILGHFSFYEPVFI